MSEKDFIKHWVDKLTSEEIKSFPQEFINGEVCTSLALPGKALVISNEFFGSYEITTIDGEAFYLTNNYEEAKYIIYANRTKPISIMAPEEKNDFEVINNRYEDYLALFIHKINEFYQKNFSGENNFHSVINEIFRRLNIIKY
jgi:hypothetical protein